MINIIWQTKKDNISILNDETNGQYEYITKIIFKYVEYKNYFDNKQYSTYLDNSIIIYSEPSNNISEELKNYLNKYKELNYKYILFHLSNENLNHNCDYYNDAEHVFRFYYDSNIKNKNITTLPLGFVSGYMNNQNVINLSDNRDILVSFIGQVKSDRKELVDTISNIDNNFLHLTSQWDCPNGLSFEQVIEIYKRTKFTPCPMGWSSPDSLRLFDSLEWGCIPIIKKYNGEDYFKNIFGEHPLPLVNEWSEIYELINKLNSNDLDELIIKINKWYKKYIDSVSLNVWNIINKMSKKESVSFVITSCNRLDLLEKTIDSFIKYNTYPISKYILIDDSGNIETFEKIKKLNNKYNNIFDLIFNYEKIGQTKSIDKAYSFVDTDYIFHCEDDWEFYRTDFIQKSLDVLKHDDKIIQAVIRPQSDNYLIMITDGIFETKNKTKYRKVGLCNIIVSPITETNKCVYNYGGFTHNPTLKRVSDYKLLESYDNISYISGSEEPIDKFYQNLGYYVVSISENDNDGYMRHIGWDNKSQNPIL